MHQTENMTARLKYVKRQSQFIIAVQLDLDTEGFTYQKWGNIQKCKRGDWLVRNGDDTYTIDQDTFARTYKPTGPGIFAKSSTVWVELAKAAGAIETKEGATRFNAGDYLVFNEPNAVDGYAVEKDKFEEMYELADNSYNHS